MFPHVPVGVMMIIKSSPISLPPNKSISNIFHVKKTGKIIAYVLTNLYIPFLDN